jgi:hypothetical protein
MLMFQGVVLFLLLGTIQGTVLATVDFVNYAEDPWAYASSNAVGLSMDLGEVRPYLNSLLLQGYLLNSKAFGSWESVFHNTLHNPGGYKYNCTLMNQVANQTLNCTFDMSNSTFMSNLGGFCWNSTPRYGMSVGWDNQGANYKNSTYMKNGFVKFAKALRTLAKQSFYTETGDKADTYNATGIRPNYNSTQPAQDCSDINNYLSYYYTSPGLTQNASQDWYAQINNVYW